ncbi:hypothetical protein FRACYDRAFT_262227 [Fragilariopsis cylindrus CCMP1102]|uniref:Uncharacterized protein n=1 Tax=Fragilariopsis cylindrus CCMP1102 TaxID=635003 RepID=A0A1E7F697_9STRA|nr:hypothetical protein FRACYDRAFT_262227 [Fragilariopsis cylindrus CCMP1102]|eukprot:OEU13383.1 hypothetical protein FRACYDRAFT_262227 [Fragilariopsis cylindrus CCMP1102]
MDKVAGSIPAFSILSFAFLNNSSISHPYCPRDHAFPMEPSLSLPTYKYVIDDRIVVIIARPSLDNNAENNYKYCPVQLYVGLKSATGSESEIETNNISSSNIHIKEFWMFFQLALAWLASGRQERTAITAVADLESNTYENLLSYNEVMEKHRKNRIPLWNTDANMNPITKDIATTTIITRKDVNDSVRTVQLALLKILDCEDLARDYEWDQLITTIDTETLLRTDLEKACYVLKSANEFLSREARDEIGFDWGSCAWRHCGALSDYQEAIDALEYQVGMLEPYECLFVLDVIERSLRDILAVTNDYHHDTITIDASSSAATISTTALSSSSSSSTLMKVPKYIPLQRMSDMSNEEEEDGLDRSETEYLKTLSLFRNSES